MDQIEKTLRNCIEFYEIEKKEKINENLEEKVLPLLKFSRIWFIYIKFTALPKL